MLPTLDAAALLDRLRTLFVSDDPDVRTQGTELLLSLDDPSLFDQMLDGTALGLARDPSGGESHDTLVPGAYFHAAHRGHRASLAAMCWRVTLVAPPSCAVAVSLRAKLRRLSFSTDWNDRSNLDLRPYASLPNVEHVSVHVSGGGALVGLSALATLPSLRSLILNAPLDAEGVRPLAGAASLRALTLGFSCGPHASVGLDTLVQLTELTVRGQLSASLRDRLGALTSLERLECYFNLGLRDLRPLQTLRALRSLHLHEEHDLKAFDGAEHLTQLEALRLDTAGVQSLSALAGLPSLHTLSFSSLPPDCDVSALGALPALRHFRCRTVRHPDLAPLSSVNLHSVDMHTLSAFTDLRCLAGSIHLERFDAREAHALVSFEGLRPENPIGFLWFDNTPMLERLGPLPRAVVVVSLDSAPKLTDLSGVRGCDALRDLTLRNASSLTDLAPLAGLPSLERLTIHGATALTDLTALAKLPSLVAVTLQNCAALRDLTPLLDAPALRAVCIHGSPWAREAVPSGLLARCAWDAKATVEKILERQDEDARRAKQKAALDALDPLWTRWIRDGDAVLDETLSAMRTLTDDARWRSVLLALRWMPESAENPGRFAFVDGSAELPLELDAHSPSTFDRLVIELLCAAPPSLTEDLRASITTLRWIGRTRDHDVDLARLPPLPALHALTFEGICAVDGIEALRAHAPVRAVTWRRPGLADLPQWPSLASLEVHEARAVNVRSIFAHTGLEHLALTELGVRPLSAFKGVNGLASLRSLTLAHEAASGALDLSGCAGLQTLSLQGMQARTLRAIWPTLGALRSLELVGVKGLSDLDFVKHLPALESLRVVEAARLRDLRPLASLRALRTLRLERCPWVADVTPLLELPALAALSIVYANGKSPTMPAALRAKVV